MVNGATASGITVGTADGDDTITAVRGLGGIVGRMTVTGGILDCTNYADIVGTSTSSGNVGGIVGAAYYTANNSWMILSGCKNYGDISNKCMGVGGIAGLSAAGWRIARTMAPSLVAASVRPVRPAPASAASWASSRTPATSPAVPTAGT